jgi:hypothetical protein
MVSPQRSTLIGAKPAWGTHSCFGLIRTDGRSIIPHFQTKHWPALREWHYASHLRPRPSTSAIGPSPARNDILMSCCQWEESLLVTFWSAASRLILVGFVSLLASVTDGLTAELKILTPRSMWTVLNEIGPQFERTSGYKLNVVTGIAATLADRIIEGDSFDGFIGPPVQIDRLIKSNKIIADMRTAIAHSGIGVEVRAGTPKPNIGSVETFKQALLNAKSIWLSQTRRNERRIFARAVSSTWDCGSNQIQSCTPRNRHRFRTRRQG